MSINNNPYDKTHTEESKYNHLIIISLTQKFSCRSFYFHSCLSCLVVTANMAVTIIMKLQQQITLFVLVGALGRAVAICLLLYIKEV